MKDKKLEYLSGFGAWMMDGWTTLCICMRGHASKKMPPILIAAAGVFVQRTALIGAHDDLQTVKRVTGVVYAV
jgi:hypothetical protein